MSTVFVVNFPLLMRGDDMAFTPLAQVDELEDGFRKVVTIAGKELMLIQDQGQRFLIDNICPHMDRPLTRGIIKDCTIQCPAHGLTYQLSDGEACNALESAGMAGTLTRYAVLEDGGAVGVSDELVPL
ncbi:MAG: Rieske 2Fe-2S domain-containing protein [Cellvibrionaceae bacterium]